MKDEIIMTGKELENKDEKVFGIIYAIRNKVNDKYYVGKTVKTFYKRYCIKDKKNPIEDLSKNTHNKYLKRAINKYGFENFEVIPVLDKAYSKEQLDELEKYYIALYRTEKYGGVYNITTGGDDGYTFINSFVTKLKNINIIKNTKTICCLTLNKVFIDIDEITKFYKNENVFNIQPEDIIKCCNGQSEYSGKSVNGKPLKWKFISDCEKNELNNILKNETDKNKIILINNELKRIEDLEYLNSIDSNIISNKNNKPVYSPTLDKIFSSQAEAFNFTKDKKYFDVVSDRICECCEGKRISTGKVKNGERIEWIYLSYCNKEKLTNLLSKETNGLNIVLIKAELEKFKDPEYEKIIEEKNEEIKKKIDEMKKNEKEKLKIKTIKPHHTSQAVYSPTLNMLFQSIRKANYFCKENNYKSYCKGINDCCKGNERYSKKLPDDTPIEWKYLSYCTKQTLEELLTKESNETKIYILKNELEKFKDPEYEKIVEEKNKELEEKINKNEKKEKTKNKKNKIIITSIPIYSSTLNMFFLSFKEAGVFIDNNNNLKCNKGKIPNCCKGIESYCGETSNGTPIEWKYLSYCTKQTLEELLTKESDETKIYVLKNELEKFKDPEYEKIVEEKNKELEKQKIMNIYKTNRNLKPIYSPTLDMLFINNNEIENFSKNNNLKFKIYGDTGILKCCKGIINNSGKLQDGTLVKWQYISNVNKQTLNKLLTKEFNKIKIFLIKKELLKFEELECTESTTKIKIDIRKIPVYSPTLNRMFTSFSEATKFTMNKKMFISAAGKIKDCCKKERNYSGMLLNGTQLEWKYLSDVDKQTLEELLKNEIDEEKIYWIKKELPKFENVQYTRSLEEKRENFINKEILKKSYTIPVYSLTLDKVFISFAEAVRFTKNKKIFKYSAIHVKECCKKERRYSGILLDGTLLEWAYLSDVDKQTLEKLLLKETDEDKIIALRRELLKFKK